MNILVDGQVLETPEINRGIGVYFKNTIINMLKYSTGDTWFITVTHPKYLECLGEWAQKRITPLIGEEFKPTPEYSNTERYESSLNELIEKYKIDCYWNPDPLMVNVLFPQKILKCRMILTVHDLIPYIMPIKEWSKEVSMEYNRRIQFLRNKELTLICVSKSTENDVHQIEEMQAKTVVIPEAANEKVFYRTGKVKTEEPTVVFTGGFDYRKNMKGVLLAFQKFLESNTDLNKTKLYVVCKYDNSSLEAIKKEIKEQYYSNIVFTNYIPDDELVKLYTRTHVFFFPSLYEGFGLPILEAMMGGALVVTSNVSSLPEVSGADGILCNPTNVQDMAEKLGNGLRIALAESSEARTKRQQYALGFSWKRTAQKTYELIKSNNKALEVNKRKLALVTPWPVQKTGIANYEANLVPFLQNYFEVDVFTESKDENHDANIYELNELETRYSLYDDIIYEIGNNALFHKEICLYAARFPGVVELHDYVLSSFFEQSYLNEEYEEFYKQALLTAYGEDGKKFYENVKNNDWTGVENFPMADYFSYISNKVIVHNNWSKNQMNKKDNVEVIPLSCFEIPNQRENTDLLERIGISEQDIVIGCFGFVNFNKRGHIVLEAVQGIVNTYPNVKLVFWGEDSGTMEKRIEQLNGEKVAKVSGYLSESDYYTALNRTDIVINLRYPSMGESSGTLCESLKSGKPVIVSDIAQYKEFPNDVCWKLPVCTDRGEEVYILTRYMEALLDDKALRKQLGENAKWYADEILNPASIAERYYELLSE